MEGSAVQQARRRRWVLAGVLFLALVALIDGILDDFSVIGAYGVAPFIAAVGGTKRQTVGVALLALAATVAVGLADGMFDDLDYYARVLTVAVACAVAVQVAGMRNRDELTAALESETARTLAAAPSPEEATQLIVERLARALGWQAGAFWELDPHRDLLRCVALWHDPGLDADRFLEATRALELEGAGLPGEVWRAGHAVWVDDVRADPGFLRADSAAAAGLRGGAAFPIVSSERVQGVIEFFTTAAPKRDPVLLRAMDGVGAQLGQYIERRRASAEAERSGALKSAVVDSALDCVITMDDRGLITDFSRGAERTFGHTREAVIGKELAETIIPPDLRERHRAGMRRYLETGEASILNRRLELTGMRSDGSLFPAEVSVTHVAGSDPPLFAGYLRDITDRKEAEDERERLLSRERDQRLRAQRLERRASYLSEVQRTLDASIDDYEDALRKLARLVVPRLGDWCVVHTLEDDGELRMVAVEHSDPAKRALAWEMQSRYPTNLAVDRNLARVLRTGKPDLVPEIPPELLDAAARDTEHADMIRTLGLHSGMIVPLRARGQVLGAISFALAESEQRYDEDDLAFATEVARRGGLSISNARLYHDAHRRQQEIEFLARAGIELDATLDVEQTLTRLADLTVPDLADGCMVDLLEEGDRMRRVASASANPEVLPVLTRLREHELDLASGHPIAMAMRTGEVQVVKEISPELQRTWSPDPDYLRALEDWPARSAVVAPMVVRGRVLGTIALASFGARVFTPRDVVVIEELARRAAVSVYNSRLYSERSYIASRLQHSLLPPHLPEVPGMEIAARFRPAGEANEVGGDFYDIFETAAGHWALVIGDVCGKGADAAAVTAIARYTLRAAAMQSEEGPERALLLLNNVLMQQMSPDRFCTVAYATLDLDEGTARLSLASGGHPTPLIVRADGRVTPVGQPGTLLGVVPDPALHEVQEELHPGDSVVFYTDGLTEARTRDGLFDEERLIETLQRCGGLDPPAVTDHIEQALTDLRAVTRDDIALLVAQVSRHGPVRGALSGDVAAMA